MQLHIFIFLHCSNNGFYWELPSCGTFDAISIQGDNNSCAAQCQLHSSWLKYCLDTDKKGVKPFLNDLLSWLCSCITVFYRMHSTLMPVIGNQGILQWRFPPVSSSLLTLYRFTTSKTGTYHLHWERQENTFSGSWIFHWALSHLSMSLWCADTRLWISLISNNDNTALAIEVAICWYKATHV